MRRLPRPKPEAVRHFALGPGLWSRVEPAEAKNELDRNRWDRGVVATSRLYDSSRGPFLVLQLAIGGGVGVPLGNAVAALSLPLQFLLGATGAILAFWALPLVWSALVAFRAPVRQCDALRTALDAERVERAGREAELQRLSETHYIREQLALSFLEATERIPPLLDQIGPEVTAKSHSGARNRALHALRNWVQTTVPLLRAGAQPDLADKFESHEGEDVGTRDGIQRAYEKRLVLLTPFPPYLEVPHEDQS